MSSLIRSVHKTMKVVMRLLNISRTSYVPKSCFKCEAVDDLSVDLNSAASVPTCSGKIL